MPRSFPGSLTPFRTAAAAAAVVAAYRSTAGCRLPGESSGGPCGSPPGTSQAPLQGEGPPAVLAGEIGGGNGIEPLSLAARRGWLVVDADLMGRAFPELQAG